MIQYNFVIIYLIMFTLIVELRFSHYLTILSFIVEITSYSTDIHSEYLGLKSYVGLARRYVEFKR